MQWWAELKRRRVFRLAGLYIVGAWMFLQVCDLLFPRFGISDAVLDILFYGALAGFPVALAFSWTYDLTPQGIVRTHRLRADDDGQEVSLRPADYLVLGGLAIVLAGIVYRAVVEVAELPPEGAEPAMVIDAPANSIAVMPLTNMSSNRDNDFFCDGVSEDILNRLGEHGDLAVIGRTSSFSLRNSGYAIPRIAALLGVRYLLQGSVRQSGNRLRISTQLVDHKGQQVWQSTYDRELQDIFAIQTEISEQVARAIVPRVAVSEEVKSAPNVEAYEEFLVGRELLINRVAGFPENAPRHFERAIELDPEFAEAYAGLGTIQGLLSFGGSDKELREAALANIEKALSLDPELAMAHAARGLILSGRSDSDLEEAESALRKAISINRSYVPAYNWLSGVVRQLGREEESLDLLQRAARIDPLAPVINVNLAMREKSQGRVEAAEARLVRLTKSPRPASPVFIGLRILYLQQGRLFDALQVALEGSVQMARQAGRSWGSPVGHLYTMLGLWPQAEQWIDRANLDSPDPLQVTVRNGVLNFATGEVERLRESIRAYFRQPGNMPSVEAGSSWHEALFKLSLLLDDDPLVIDFLLENLDVASRRMDGPLNENNESIFAALAWRLQQSGRSEEAEPLIVGMERHYLEMYEAGLSLNSWQIYEWAAIALLRGDKETAIVRFARAVEEGWCDYFIALNDPRWEPLRSNPEYQALMRQVADHIAAERQRVLAEDLRNPAIPRLEEQLAAWRAEQGEDGIRQSE